jgi:hypothetical protein
VGLLRVKTGKDQSEYISLLYKGGISNHSMRFSNNKNATIPADVG